MHKNCSNLEQNCALNKALLKVRQCVLGSSLAGNVRKINLRVTELSYLSNWIRQIRKNQTC